MLTQPTIAPATTAVPSQIRSTAASITQHLFFFDNLRVVAMVMVIVQHVGQAYGPTGGAWLIQEPNRAAVLGPFFTVNRSFGMTSSFPGRSVAGQL